MLTYYEILGVSEKVSAQEIKHAYRELMKRYHPDKNLDRAEATKQAQLINEAYTILKDPVKRIEYDNFLSLQRQNETTGVFTSAAEAPPTEVPHYRCEKCGRQDATLRVSIFLWVISALVITYKKGWGGILCSRCRIKYSLLFNLEAWFLGWWGFPWGPIYTLEALFKNSSGGIQPPENNASLLSVLAYDLYQQGRYTEAFEAVSESYKIRPSKELKEFLDYIAPYSAQQKKGSFFDRALQADPAWYNVPALVTLLVLSLVVIISTQGTERRDYRAQYSQTQSVQSPKPHISKKDFVEITNILDIDLNDIEESADICNQTVKEVASYIRSNIPVVDTTYESGNTVYHYVLDRSKLEDKSVQQYTNAIRSEVSKVFGIYRSISPNSVGFSSEQKEKAKQLQSYLEDQLNFMLSAFFNVWILEASIAFMHELDSIDVSNETVRRVLYIGQDSILQTWLKENKSGEQYTRMLSLIASYLKNQKDLKYLEKKIYAMSSNIESEVEIITEWETKLSDYVTAGKYEQYDSLAIKYNSLIESTQRNMDKYDSLVLRYNVLLEECDFNKIDCAFNDCLDPAIFSTVFEAVDLHTADSLQIKEYR